MRAASVTPRNAVVEQSRVDLADDFADMTTITRHRVRALRRLRSELTADAVPEWARNEVLDAIDRSIAADLATTAELRTMADAAHRDIPLDRLVAQKRRLAEVLRTRQAMAASYFTATDWHSPSIDYSVYSSAGRHTGRVVAHRDDYKRDRHPDQAHWERAWQGQMVDNPSRQPLRALMTASGMAAFTTILDYVEAHADTHRPVIIGSGLYHESRQLLSRSSMRDRIIAIPESDEAGWTRALEVNPGAIFLDTMCNAAGLAVPDVAWLVKTLHDRGQPTLLVLDNTARSVSLQPWHHIAPNSVLRMIVFESLTKYPQMGMDRAAGGVIVSRQEIAEELDTLREHLGTNIADVVAHQHPHPDRRLLERRLHRIGRNAALIADIANDRVTALGLPVRIVYPGLPGRSNLPSDFQGGYLAVAACQTDAVYRRLLSAILALANQRDVAICEGTSFGFDTTRIYLAAANPPGTGPPFLRVSAGSEHLLGAHTVASVLADCLEQIR